MNWIVLVVALTFASLLVVSCYVIKNKQRISFSRTDRTSVTESQINEKFSKPVDYALFSKVLLIVLASMFACAFIVRLFCVDYFLNVSVTVSNPLFSQTQIVFVTILRFFMQALVPILIVAPFFNLKYLNKLLAVFGTIIVLLNIIFLNFHLMAFQGEKWAFDSFRGIQFSIECCIALLICAVCLFNSITNKDFQVDFKKRKTYKDGLLLFAGLFAMGIAMTPPCTLYNLFGACVPEADGFSLTHRIALYFVIVAGLALYFVFKKKDDKVKWAVCVMLAITGCCSFFYVLAWPLPLTSLPLHLCNAALILGLFAFVFREKKLFYFTYFVNVLGAICALTMPNTEGSFFLYGNIRFWLDHIVVVILPIVAVSWKLFPRPNIKAMYYSILVFVCYFVVACGSNMIISNFEPDVNYFYLQDDFFVDKFPWAFDLRNNWCYTFELFGLSLTVWPVYWFGIFVVYIALMFLMWLFYSYLYKISDALSLVKKYEIMDRLDMVKFRKDVLKNGDINTPKKGEESKIVIKNFSKMYSGSKVFSVEDFSLEVDAGTVFGFIGHNGAGKSTLIKSMVGIQTITSGSISICGFDITHQPLQAKLIMGYVSDNHAVYEKLSGREYVNYVADLYRVSKEDRDARIKKYCDMFALNDAIDREIKGYSHGMKQKLVIIASLIHDPKVWILDEPLTGLDPVSSHQIKTLMRERADNGGIVFFSSHVIEIVEKICDKIAIISRGKLKGVFDAKMLKEISMEDLYIDIYESNEQNSTKIEKKVIDKIKKIKTKKSKTS